jgi:hypothetical protein
VFWGEASRLTGFLYWFLVEDSFYFWWIFAKFSICWRVSRTFYHCWWPEKGYYFNLDLIQRWIFRTILLIFYLTKRRTLRNFLIAERIELSQSWILSNRIFLGLDHHSW